MIKAKNSSAPLFFHFMIGSEVSNGIIYREYSDFTQGNEVCAGFIYKPLNISSRKLEIDAFE